MADYVMEAVIRLRVKDVEDEYDGWEKAMEFFSQGLEYLACSSDPDDDHYEFEERKVLTFKED